MSPAMICRSSIIRGDNLMISDDVTGCNNGGIATYWGRWGVERAGNLLCMYYSSSYYTYMYIPTGVMKVFHLTRWLIYLLKSGYLCNGIYMFDRLVDSVFENSCSWVGKKKSYSGYASTSRLVSVIRNFRVASLAKWWDDLSLKSFVYHRIWKPQSINPNERQSLPYWCFSQNKYPFKIHVYSIHTRVNIQRS